MNEATRRLLNDLLVHAQRKSPLTRIAARIMTLKGKTRDVAQFLVNDTDLLADMTIEEIAAACNTSRATILRMSNELGYNNFSHLRKDLLNMDGDETDDDADGSVCANLDQQGTEGGEVDEGAVYYQATSGTLDGGMGAGDSLYEAMHRCMTMLLDTFSTVEATRITQAADLLVSRSPIAVYGGAMSGGIARVIQNRFRWMGLSAYASSDVEGLVHDMRHRTGLLLCVSHLGSTPNVLRVLNQARQNGVPTILLVNLEGAPACREADVVLPTSITSLMTHGYDVLARTSQLYVLELLCTVMAKRMANRQGGAGE